MLNFDTSLYQTFPVGEARRIAKRLEFHYTTKHGSWLKMAEIEFSILSRSCLRQRLPDEESPYREATPWNWNETKLKLASTGASASRTPELNSIDCIPSIPDLVEWVWATGGWLLNVARRRPESHRFEVLPRRCVVQRSPALLSRCQRLGRDDEELPETGETWVHTRNATGGPNLTEFPF